jgi:hypothetical protein
MRNFALLVATLALSVVGVGCSTTAVTPGKIDAIDRKSKGFALVSTDSRAQALVEYYVRSAKDGYSGPSSINGSQPLWLFAFEPGRYSIADWYMAAGVQKRARGSKRYEFDVVAGEVTYIGHLAGNFSTSKDLFGIKWVPNASPVVKDRAVLDVAEFLKAYPSLADVKVRNAAVDGFDWGVKTESTVPVPVVLPK